MMTSTSEIQGLLKSFRGQQKELIDHIVSLTWHMRGGLTREDAWTLSFEERKRYMHFIDERIKSVEKTGLPIL